MRDRADILPTGTPIGWGTAARDHNDQGLFHDGPQPASTFYRRLVVSSMNHPEPLPPALAQLVLTREAVKRGLLRQMLFRAAIGVRGAQLPIERIRRHLRRNGKQ